MTEGMHLEQIQRHRQVRRAIEDISFSWGYRPIETPLLDEYDIYREHMEQLLLQESYRMIDRNGKVMLLRSDNTLFLASQLGRHLQNSELPLRISYADSVIRYQSEDEIYHGNGFQTGAELIGVAGNDGDAEILLLAASIFRQLQIPRAAMHIGSRHLLHCLFPASDSARISAIAEAVRLRQQASIIEIAAESCCPGLSPQRISQLLSLIAESENAAETFADYISDDQLPEQARAEIRRIIDLAQLIKQLEPDFDIRVDFSEVGVRTYYTGMAFQIYCDGAARPAASGGRYDSLLGSFGCQAPSVGFALMQSIIEPLIPTSCFHADNISIQQAQGKDFLSRWKAAIRIRKNGGAAQL
ncbi:MAG: ATP phosphoribosyltransferase regulatory subunit [Spirochaetaceae bacterium]|nr:MAG: ATP phosphoribosyltransferase regulatory subunit [Spirochaetaceae bacterium]